MYITCLLFHDKEEKWRVTVDVPGRMCFLLISNKLGSEPGGALKADTTICKYRGEDAPSLKADSSSSKAGPIFTLFFDC